MVEWCEVTSVFTPGYYDIIASVIVSRRSLCRGSQLEGRLPPLLLPGRVGVSESV